MTTTRYRYTDENNAHLHELRVGDDWKPLVGTSTVMNVLSKPLTWWAAGLAVAEFGWLHEKDNTAIDRYNAAQRAQNEVTRLSADEYLKKLDKAYKAHSTVLRSAAGEGTDLHAELSGYISACIAKRSGVPVRPEEVGGSTAVQRFARFAFERIAQFNVSEGHCYSERLWTGGITDLVAYLKHGETAVIDFKRAKDAYFSHFVQLAGYAIAIEENGVVSATGEPILPPVKADCLILLPFGGGKARKEPFSDDYRDAFEAAVKLYSMQRDYDKP